ncbi:hypothetical protein HMPREF9554_03184 [Treponema phagedenis F0421]|nr:hypothetical protein HMPREF9554_03184 [Treponema phagedenis F0421]
MSNQNGHGRPWFQTDGLVFAMGGKTQKKFKRCLKASIQNYKIEAFKLAALI